MTRITRDDVTRAVGQADDVTIAKIIATGATAEELAKPSLDRKRRAVDKCRQAAGEGPRRRTRRYPHGTRRRVRRMKVRADRPSLKE